MSKVKWSERMLANPPAGGVVFDRLVIKVRRGGTDSGDMKYRPCIEYNFFFRERINSEPSPLLLTRATSHVSPRLTKKPAANQEKFDILEQ